MSTRQFIASKCAPVPFPSFTPVRSGLLQRKCACGGRPGPSGECEACRKKRLQRKARSPGVGTESDSAVPPIVHEVLRSPGKPLDEEMRAFMEPRFGHDFSRVRVPTGSGSRATVGPIHVDGLEEDDPIHRPVIEQFRLREGLPLSGVDESGQRVGPSDAEIKYGRLGSSSSASSANAAATPPSPQAAVTPCPATVRVGAMAQRNHSNLSATEKEQWGTWLGAMSRMDVGPGPDHTGHCMKERLTTISDNCPASMYTRGGQTTQPCSGNRCLDINRYGNMWGVSDGPTAFLDMHRTRAPNSLLEGTGISSCTVVCEQRYSCDRTQLAAGTFQITRNFQAGSHTRADGTTMHITTGTVTKT